MSTRRSTACSASSMTERDTGASPRESPDRKTLDTGTFNIWKLKTALQVPVETGQSVRTSCLTFFAKPSQMAPDPARFVRPFTMRGKPIALCFSAQAAAFATLAKAHVSIMPSDTIVDCQIEKSSRSGGPRVTHGEEPRCRESEEALLSPVALGTIMCRPFHWKWSTGDMPRLCARTSTGILRKHCRQKNIGCCPGCAAVRIDVRRGANHRCASRARSPASSSRASTLTEPSSETTAHSRQFSRRRLRSQKMQASVSGGCCTTLVIVRSYGGGLETRYVLCLILFTARSSAVLEHQPRVAPRRTHLTSWCPGNTLPAVHAGERDV